jgi:predicted acetyltransferase
MGGQLRWVGDSELDVVARTRHRCYAGAQVQLDKFMDGIRADGRAKPGDFLLAEIDGEPVGTSTAISLQMRFGHVRVPCQGIAYVGTVKTHRRMGSSGEAGIATLLMHECLRVGRERGQVVSALMPFRASYYEHFGYGFCEHRTEWTIPMGILPKGNGSGFRFFEDKDLPALQRLREREVQQYPCDIETSPEGWAFWKRFFSEGLMFVRPRGDGELESSALILDERDDKTGTARVADFSAESDEALVRLLHFLGTLRDQYSAAVLTLPGDVPLNLLLKETQIPHRQVDHPVASARPFTRMQMRVLDYPRFFALLPARSGVKAQGVLEVIESAGPPVRLAVAAEDGKFHAEPTSRPVQVTLSDVSFASLVSGHFTAGQLLRWGKLSLQDAAAVPLLAAFGFDRLPFCQEYF